MAPVHDSPASSSWGPSTTIELMALIVAIPGAVAALATLWIILSRRRTKNRTEHMNRGTASRTLALRTLTSRRDAGDANIGSFDWFQEHYDDLHGEVTAERQQWAEERSCLTRRS